VNIPEAALGFITANTLTTSLFGVDIVTFLTQGWDGKAEGHSWELTLPELLGRVSNLGVYGPTAKGATGSSEGRGYVPTAMKKNLRDDAPMAVGGLITAMIVNGAAKKFGLYRRMNRLVRQVGAGKVVKFS